MLRKDFLELCVEGSFGEMCQRIFIEMRRRVFWGNVSKGCFGVTNFGGKKLSKLRYHKNENGQMQAYA